MVGGGDGDGDLGEYSISDDAESVNDIGLYSNIMDDDAAAVGVSARSGKTGIAGEYGGGGDGGSGARWRGLVVVKLLAMMRPLP